MKKNFPRLLLALLVVAVASTAALQAQRKPVRTPVPTQRNNKLHEMAVKAGGKHVLRYKPRGATLYPNVEELAKRSDIVIVGRALTYRSKLSADGNFLNQECLVRVQEVIKGDLTNGRSITVSLPGGSYMFPDRTFITVVPIGIQPIEKQGTYVFFLKAPKGVNSGASSKQHFLASQTQGMFGLANGKVRSSSLAKDDPVAVKYQDMGAADFLRELHRAIPRKERKADATGK